MCPDLAHLCPRAASREGVGCGVLRHQGFQDLGEAARLILPSLHTGLSLPVSLAQS